MPEIADLKQAWDWRQKRGLFTGTQALRIFHGPGEGSGTLSSFAVDRFGDHAWVTHWETGDEESGKVIEGIVEFLMAHEIRSAVGLFRPKKGLPEEPRVLYGNPPADPFEVGEEGARFLVRLSGARHPGLFLDHLPLRRWLRAHSKGLKVLNTFAYTGSLSVAAGLGGASEVTTLDLSKTTVAWAEQNWALNALPQERAHFVVGDVFEWLPKLRRQSHRFDCVILDPPSFSRGRTATFSTAKDLPRLHGLAMDLLAPGGVLATSINSAQITRGQFEKEVLEAARIRKLKFDVLAEIGLPETFPTRPDSPSDRYLKGWILKGR